IDLSVYIILWLLCFFFFFQAEDGIRDLIVTGVQTCALPIWPRPPARPGRRGDSGPWPCLGGRGGGGSHDGPGLVESGPGDLRRPHAVLRLRPPRLLRGRSEERRVGKEC